MALAWVLGALAVYAGLLFAAAAWADGAGARLDRSLQRRSLIYALGLAVYCTSWTFYGAVGEAARQGWDYLPIYLGPALLFLAGFGVIRRLVRLGRDHDSASIADFLSARYGKSSSVAAAATLLLLLSSLPYIALQLRSAEASLEMITGAPLGGGAGPVSLLAAAVFAGFAIAFGLRHADTAHANRGFAVAIAIESGVKLAAMTAVGLFAAVLLAGLEPAVLARAWRDSALSAPGLDFRFLVLTLLAAFAALCLPRQFHMMVVEAVRPRDSERARILFPAYLLGVALVAPPVALAGAALLGSANPDQYVLALPLYHGAEALAVFAFIGGISAAAGMVTVAVLALSNMVVNGLIGPQLVRSGYGRKGSDIARLLLGLRRIAVAAIVAAAWLVHAGLDSRLALADIGLVSFAGAAQLAPALLFGLFWRRANRAGALAGVLTGGIAWLALVVSPGFLGASLPAPAGADPFSFYAVVSLGMNASAFIFAVAFAPSGLVDRLQAGAFVSGARHEGEDELGGGKVADLDILLARVLGGRDGASAMAAFGDHLGRPLKPGDVVTPALASLAEARLARAVGASSARLLMTRVLPGNRMTASEVVALLDETAGKIRFSEDVLTATLEHLSQGVSVVDGDLRLAAWNSRYVELFGYPAHLVRVGRPIADLIRWNAERGECGPGEVEAHVAKRLEHMGAGTEHAFERVRSDGVVLEILGRPMPGGGYVTSYADITERKRTEDALKAAYDTLEDKVEERTAALKAESEARLALARDLEAARAQAEAVNASKTRFLAAASHDLLQPLSAARLLSSALDTELKDAPEDIRSLIGRIDRSIANGDRLLRALLDISRLDAGGVTPQMSVFPLQELMEEAAAQFAPLAEGKGLNLKVAPSSLWVRSDRGLMTSVLQNLLSNAVRYTESGRVLIGVRRSGGQARLQVADTGPGVEPAEQVRIFGEFERAGKRAGEDRGLGLGLAIVERIVKRLGQSVSIASVPGRGSVFEVTLERAEPGQIVEPRRTSRRRTASLDGLRVLCIENEPPVLEATLVLLRRWGCDARGAADRVQAETAFPDAAPDFVLLDFMLDDGDTGPRVYEHLCAMWEMRPAGLVATAERGGHADAAARQSGLEILRKPVALAALRAAIGELARRRRSGRAQAAE